MASDDPTLDHRLPDALRVRPRPAVDRQLPHVVLRPLPPRLRAVGVEVDHGHHEDALRRVGHRAGGIHHERAGELPVAVPPLAEARAERCELLGRDALVSEEHDAIAMKMLEHARESFIRHRKREIHAGDFGHDRADGRNRARIGVSSGNYRFVVTRETLR